MLSDWIQWLSSQSVTELLWFLLPMACLDGTRYGLSLGAMCLWDAGRRLLPLEQQPIESYCPSICVVLAGLNEGESIGQALNSVWNSYPRLEIVVVDDGSTDDMSAIAHRFAQTHSGVLVLTRPQRGGKSAAMNLALPFTKAEIIVVVDADSHLQPGALEEIVQPFADPRVGAVGGTILARNAHTNLLTRLQASEYLHSIFLGRMLMSRLGMLGIVSGAFGAFRREALRRTHGWDVGPGEDGDLVLRLRKGGWLIRHAPYATCLTDVPVQWGRLFKQRRRWDWSIVTFECRKHVDLANWRSPNFRLSNLVLLADGWVFRLGLTLLMPLGLLWLMHYGAKNFVYGMFMCYLCYVLLYVMYWLIAMYYTEDLKRDAWTILCAPLMPFYFAFLKSTTLVAIIEELFWRRSYRDAFVPEHVSAATWQW